MRERWREKDIFRATISLSYVTTRSETGLGQAPIRNQELHPSFPHGWQGSSHPSHLLLPKYIVRLESEQVGLQWTFKQWEAGDESCTNCQSGDESWGLTCCAIKPTHGSLFRLRENCMSPLCSVFVSVCFVLVYSIYATSNIKNICDCKIKTQTEEPLGWIRPEVQ